MNLEQQVCTLIQAKRLKELGVKQESLFRWVSGRMEYGYEGEWHIAETEEDNYFIFDHEVGQDLDADDFRVDAGYSGSIVDEDFEKIFDKWERRKNKKQKLMLSKVCSAFTCAELGVMLPSGIYQTKEYGENFWTIGMQDESVTPISSEISEADCRALMLIHLLESKSITPQEVKL